MKKYLLSLALCSVIINSNAQSCTGSNISTGILAEYNFTGNAKDSSGNNNNGTVYGCTLVANRFGTANSAYSFNGTSDSIAVPNSNSLQFTSDNQSISFWMNVAVIPNPSLNNEGIIAKMNENLTIDPTGNSAQGFYITFGQSGNGTIYYSVKSGSSSSWATATVSSTLLAANTWENIIFTFNSSTDSVYAYLNGALVNQSSIPSGTVIGQNTLPLLIGWMNWTSNSNAAYPFDGVLDDIRIYDKALNICEVDSIYNIVTTPNCSAIAKKYALDSIANAPNWSYARITLPAGAKLDSVYGGIQRPGYSGGSLSYICNYNDSTNLLNQTTSSYNPYTGPYMQWINVSSYNIIGGNNSYVDFSITQSDGMIFDSAMIAYSCAVPTGVNEISNATTINIFPNPATSIINIKASDQKISEVIITDMLGRQVYDKSFTNQINVSSLNAGIYVITLRYNSGKIYRSKIVKE